MTTLMGMPVHVDIIPQDKLMIVAEKDIGFVSRLETTIVDKREWFKLYVDNLFETMPFEEAFMTLLRMSVQIGLELYKADITFASKGTDQEEVVIKVDRRQDD